jgi:hypothetical protein
MNINNIGIIDNTIFNSDGYINTIDGRLGYINSMEADRIRKYGENYMEYIETVYYENDINEPLDDEYIGISLDDLVNVILRVDMVITSEYIKYIDGLIYDIDGIDIWNGMNIVEQIKIYQLLSLIKKYFGINELNQLHNISSELSRSLLNNKYEHICYITFDNKRLTGLAILYDDDKSFASMMRNDLDIDNKYNIKYIHQIYFIDKNNKIISKIEHDYIIMGIYIGDINEKQKVYWRWKDYKLLNDYFIGRIFDRNNNEVNYDIFMNVKDDIIINKCKTRDIKLDTKRRRLMTKRKRDI